MKAASPNACNLHDVWQAACALRDASARAHTPHAPSQPEARLPADQADTDQITSVRGMADWTDWLDAALPFADEEGKKKAAEYPLKQAALLQPYCNGVPPWHCDARMRPSECAMKASAARSTRCPWRHPLHQACAQQQRHHRALPTQPTSQLHTHAGNRQIVTSRIGALLLGKM